MASAAYTPPPGHLGNLDAEQQSALEQLRTELKDAGVYVEGVQRMGDSTLLRFLRARKFDVPKAKQMFVDCEEWRVEFGVDDIVKNFEYPELEAVDKLYAQFYHKVDRAGRPIYIESLGKLDIAALYAVTTPQRQLHRFVLEYEKFLTQRLPAASLAAGHPVETCCTIIDLAGVSLSQFYRVKDHILATARITQDRYPECLGRFYIINAPYLFGAVWSVVKGWLDEVTREKIVVLGKDYKGELLRGIAEENLPREFGGTCVCEGGCSLSDAGPWSVLGEASVLSG